MDKRTKEYKQNNKDDQTTPPNTPRRILTPEEAALSSRIEADDTKWMTIREDELNDFDLAANPMDLHPIARKLQDEKKYAFRWCERTARRADELTRTIEPPLKWGIVTRTSLPKMAHLVDDVLGCVCVLDQMLLFKPWHHHAVVKAEKNRLAKMKDEGGGTEAWAAKGSNYGAKKSGLDAQGMEEKNPYKITGSDDIQVVPGATDEKGELVYEGEDLGDMVVDE